jgi:hypothetical protein
VAAAMKSTATTVESATAMEAASAVEAAAMETTTVWCNKGVSMRSDERMSAVRADERMTVVKSVVIEVAVTATETESE